MKRIVTLCGLLVAVAFPLCAQSWTPQDSLRLQRLLNGDGEVKLNPDALKELEMNAPWGTPRADTYKSWMDFDTSLPTAPDNSEKPEKKIILTLHPYKANTKYNWDPVYQQKIKVDKNTWRGDRFYELKKRFLPSNWAVRPLDAGPRETLEQIEATGLRYRVTERANNMAVGGWQRTSSPSGLDFMTPFTRDFWNFKGRKRRARTLEVLRTYGDSTTMLIKDPVHAITEE